MTRKHRTSEEWEVIYQAWQESGLSQAKYCKQNTIPYQSLYNYIQRRSPAAIAVKPQLAPKPAFVELGNLSPENSNSIEHYSEIVLDIGKNIQLRIRQSV